MEFKAIKSDKIELKEIIFVARTSRSSGTSLQISIPEQICEFAELEDNDLIKVQLLEKKPSIKGRQKKPGRKFNTLKKQDMKGGII